MTDSAGPVTLEDAAQYVGRRITDGDPEAERFLWGALLGFADAFHEPAPSVEELYRRMALLAEAVRRLAFEELVEVLEEAWALPERAPAHEPEADSDAMAAALERAAAELRLAGER